MGGGIEVSGTIKLSCQVIKAALPLKVPRFENVSTRGCVAVASTQQRATEDAAAHMVAWLAQSKGWAPLDAYAVVSQACSLSLGGATRAWAKREYTVAVCSMPIAVKVPAAITSVRASKEEVALWLEIGSANVSDGLRNVGAGLHFCTMEGAIKPLRSPMACCGPAFTVRCYPGATFAMEKALEMAAPGDVVVVDAGGYCNAIVMGGLMSTRMQQRGVVGAVVDGAVRDVHEIESLGTFSVFSRAVSCKAGTFAEIGDCQEIVSCGRSVHSRLRVFRT